MPERLQPGSIPAMAAAFDSAAGAAYRTAVDKVPEATGAEMAFIGIPRGQGSIVLGHSVHSATSALDGVVIPAGWGLGGKVLASHRPHWVSDYPNATNITHLPQVDASVAAEGLHAILGVPIVHEDRFLGVLYAGHHDVETFGDRTIDAMIAAAQRLAGALVFAEERRRIAAELNEAVGARLAALEAGVRSLASEPGLDRRLRLRLNVLERQANEAAARLRLSLRVLNSPARPDADRERYGITAREFDVLRRVALGERNAEIAAAINISRNTVKSYLQSASQKLGARNRVEAVARAGEAGLL